MDSKVESSYAWFSPTGWVTRLLALVFITALCVELWVAPEPPAQAAEPDPKPSSESTPAGQVTTRADGTLLAPDEASARLTAARRGERVEVVSARTPESTTWVNPDGTATTDFATTPVRVRDAASDDSTASQRKNAAADSEDDPEDGWVDVDPTLEEADGALSPTASAVDVELSTGSKKADTLVSAASGDRSIGLGWTKPLPEPEVSDTEATYDLGDGTSWRVEATATGFRAHLVLTKKPQQSAPVYRLPLELDGLTVSRRSDGGFVLRDTDKKQVFDVAAPLMWDNESDAAGDPKNLVPVDAKLARNGAGQVLELRPDPEFLDGAQYPLTVDPDISSVARVRDAYVSSNTADTSYATQPYLRTGLEQGSARRRAFLHFATPNLSGTRIVRSQLRLYNYHSASCTAKNMAVRPVTQTWSSGVTWNNQPSYSTDAAYSSSKSFAHAANAGCPSGFETIDVTKMMSAWIDGSLPNRGMIFRTDESDAGAWKAFCSANIDSSHSYCHAETRKPTLSVTYNSYPGTVGYRASSPAVPCRTGADERPFMKSRTPSFSGRAHDADGGKTRVDFELRNTGSTVIADGSSPMAPQGTTATWTVPSGRLTHGSTYRWRARGYDGTDYSKAWSSFCEFTVDVSNPGAASISSTKYPAGEWSGGAGESGTFTLTPGSDTVSGPAGVYWSLDDPNPETFAATTGAAVSVPVNPPTDGKHTLYARTVDKAGNTSAVTEHVFYAGAAAVASPSEGDKTARRVSLSAQARPGTGSVTFQWRRADTDTWTAIADATDVPINDGSTAGIAWGIADEIGEDGIIQLRVITDDATESSPVSVTLDRQMSDADTEEIGPGIVNLLTGDYMMSETDASFFGVELSRSASSRDPVVGDKVTGLVSPFGPEWAAGGDSEAADTEYASIQRTSSSSVAVVLSDGTNIHFAKTRTGSGAATVWDPEYGAEDLTLKGDAVNGPFELVDDEDTKTTFTRQATGLFTVDTTTPAGGDDVTAYTYQSAGNDKVRMKRIIAPTKAVSNLSSSCGGTGTPAVGCRVLELTYAASTTATGASLGNYTGRATQVDLWATKPGTTTVAKTTLARYRYDADGRLREAWDPRMSPALKATYKYDSAGRIIEQGVPGEEPWRMTYGRGGSGDTNDGRLFTVERNTLDPDHPAAKTSIVYDVPLHKQGGGPHDLRPADVAEWGQTQSVPTDATAIYPPDQQPESHVGAQAAYSRASVTYLDVNGREVNEAEPKGGLSTTEYDKFGNTIRELSPRNRSLALAPASDERLATLGIADLSSAERADLLADLNVYDANGGRELETTGPLHEIVLPDGQTALGRTHTRNTYDQGRPAVAPTENLITKTETGALLPDGKFTDIRTTTTTYDWDLGAPILATADPDGANIRTRTVYDDQGRVVRTDMPSAVAAGRTTGADSTVTSFYTATGTGACGGRPEWEGYVCRTGPAGPISGGGSNPNQLVTSTTTYTELGDAATITETANGSTRITTTSYDSAGRVDTVAVTGDAGQAVPTTKTVYDPTTGRETATQHVGSDGSVARAITRSFDTLGQTTSYVDADGGRTDTNYDWLGQQTSQRQYSRSGSPIETRYAYDPDRGLLTSISDDVAGTFTASYDVDGTLISQELPDGVTMRQQVDSTSVVTRRGYTVNGAGVDLVLVDEQVQENAHGQWRNHTRADVSGSADTDWEYGYDQMGRMTRAEQSSADSCTSRDYEFDANSNRTRKTSRVGGPDADCPDTGGDSDASTFDTADRLSSSAYTYDAFGRTTQTPSDGRTGQLAYHRNDLVHQQTVGDERKTWQIDPISRFRSQTTHTRAGGDWGNATSEIHHYGSDGDAPDWIVDNADTGAISRMVTGIDDDLAATTSATGDAKLQITSLHGDVVQELDLSGANADRVYRHDEYGNPTETRTDGDDTAATTGDGDRYGWLGGKQRSNDTVDGTILMGVRLYDPRLGRFLQTDPIEGGSCNTYDYVCGDPVNGTDLDGRWAWLIPLGGAAVRGCVRHCGRFFRWIRGTSKPATNPKRKPRAKPRPQKPKYNKKANCRKRSSNCYKGRSVGYAIHTSNGRIWKYGITSAKNLKARPRASAAACSKKTPGKCRVATMKYFNNRWRARNWEYQKISSYYRKHGKCPPGQRKSCR